MHATCTPQLSMETFANLGLKFEISHRSLTLLHSSKFVLLNALALIKQNHIKDNDRSIKNSRDSSNSSKPSSERQAEQSNVSSGSDRISFRSTLKATHKATDGSFRPILNDTEFPTLWWLNHVGILVPGSVRSYVSVSSSSSSSDVESVSDIASSSSNSDTDSLSVS